MSFIEDWRDRGILGPEQARLLSDIENDRVFSVSAELRALLYLGVLFVAAGVGATVKRYFLELGPAAITGGLSLAVALCLAYCFGRGRPYAPGQVETPGLGFDYVLYLGCAFVGILFGYLESHYHLLAELWDYYLLGSAALFSWLGYRFDNRLVLAMGLINLGAWFGVRFERWRIPLFELRPRAILFGGVLLLCGRWTEAARIKRHFRDTYYTLGAHVLFWALLWGLFEKGRLSIYPAALAALTAATAAYAMRRRSFQYFLYAAVYGYVGLSWFLTKDWRDTGALSLYYLFSSAALIAAVFAFRRRLEQAE